MVKLVRGSLLYKWLKWGGWKDGYYANQLDICTLVRRFLLGIIKAAAFLAFGALLGVGVGMMVWMFFINTLACLLGFACNESAYGVASIVWMAMGILILVGFIVFALREWVLKLSDNHRDEPGMVRTAWRAFKEKTCFYVQVVNKEQSE